MVHSFSSNSETLLYVFELSFNSCYIVNEIEGTNVYERYPLSVVGVLYPVVKTSLLGFILSHSLLTNPYKKISCKTKHVLDQIFDDG